MSPAIHAHDDSSRIRGALANTLRAIQGEVRRIRRRMAVLVIAVVAVNTAAVLRMASGVTEQTQGRLLLGWSLVIVFSVIALRMIVRSRDRLASLWRAALQVRSLLERVPACASRRDDSGSV
jgi:hypothetical protein